jgi:hypothetical protein
MMEAADFSDTAVDRTHYQATVIVFTLMVDAVDCSETSSTMIDAAGSSEISASQLFIVTN